MSATAAANSLSDLIPADGAGAADFAAAGLVGCAARACAPAKPNREAVCACVEAQLGSDARSQREGERARACVCVRERERQRARGGYWVRRAHHRCCPLGPLGRRFFSCFFLSSCRLRRRLLSGCVFGRRFFSCFLSHLCVQASETKREAVCVCACVGARGQAQLGAVRRKESARESEAEAERRAHARAQRERQREREREGERGRTIASKAALIALWLAAAYRDRERDARKRAHVR